MNLENEIDVSMVGCGKNQIEFIEKINQKPFFSNELSFSSNAIRNIYKKLKIMGFEIHTYHSSAKTNKINKKMKTTRFSIYYKNGQEEEVIKMIHKALAYENKRETIVKTIYNGEYSPKYRHEAVENKKKKYYEDNKEKCKEYNKEYYKNNKEKSNETSKQYRQNNKEKSKEYNKKSREKNKEKIKERDREYYKNNREKINKKNKERSSEKRRLERQLKREETIKRIFGDV